MVGLRRGRNNRVEGRLTLRYVYFFSASCTTVTCSFTIDNIVESVKYNGDALTITGDDLNNWKKLKTIEFESCFDNNPGKLQVKGSDGEEGNFSLVSLGTLGEAHGQKL